MVHYSHIIYIHTAEYKLSSTFLLSYAHEQLHVLLHDFIVCTLTAHNMHTKWKHTPHAIHTTQTHSHNTHTHTKHVGAHTHTHAPHTHTNMHTRTHNTRAGVHTNTHTHTQAFSISQIQGALCDDGQNYKNLVGFVKGLRECGISEHQGSSYSFCPCVIYSPNPNPFTLLVYPTWSTRVSGHVVSVTRMFASLLSVLLHNTLHDCAIEVTQRVGVGVLD